MLEFLNEPEERALAVLWKQWRRAIRKVGRGIAVQEWLEVADALKRRIDSLAAPEGSK